MPKSSFAPLPTKMSKFSRTAMKFIAANPKFGKCPMAVVWEIVQLHHVKFSALARFPSARVLGVDLDARAAGPLTDGHARIEVREGSFATVRALLRKRQRCLR